MQLKFSKKSRKRDMASSLGGSGLKTRRAKISLKISGFQYIHLLSSTYADEIISWKEESPVFSLTHWIPLGEKIENPEDEPEMPKVNLPAITTELNSTGAYRYTASRRSCWSPASTSYPIAPPPPVPSPSAIRVTWEPCVGSAGIPLGGSNGGTLYSAGTEWRTAVR